jgi:Zn-dependent peptidase ImmA (M78 family)
MREFLIDEDHEPLPFVGSTSRTDDPIRVADRIRSILGFQTNWAAEQDSWTAAIEALREAIERVGILVAVNGVVGNNSHRKLNTAEFRGFVLVDEYAPLVFVNGSDGKAAQMFTLGHELAHVFIGSSAAFDLRQLQPAEDPGELICDRIAAEFLVPQAELSAYWPSARDQSEPFQYVARHFKISVLVAARRALDLNLIDRPTFFEFYAEYQNDERRKKSLTSAGGDFYANQKYRIGRRLATAVIQAARKGTLLYSEAYRLTGLHGKTFDGFVDYLEGGGRS